MSSVGSPEPAGARQLSISARTWRRAFDGLPDRGSIGPVVFVSRRGRGSGGVRGRVQKVTRADRRQVRTLVPQT